MTSHIFLTIQNTIPWSNYIFLCSIYSSYAIPFLMPILAPFQFCEYNVYTVRIGIQYVYFHNFSLLLKKIEQLQQHSPVCQTYGSLGLSLSFSPKNSENWTFSHDIFNSLPFLSIFQYCHELCCIYIYTIIFSAFTVINNTTPSYKKTAFLE